MGGKDGIDTLSATSALSATAAASRCGTSRSKSLRTGRRRKGAHLPDVTKPLLRKYYFSDGKGPGSAVA
ncbi:MAG: hypothetical protein LBG15_13495 [Dysgonamonadaceae bacterium]|nr:hypothetical protein [Dysgonamonadaceae bacterium]